MKVDTNLTFTAQNISMPALHFKWVGANSTSKQEVDQSESQVMGGFSIDWQLKGSEMATYETKDGTNEEQQWKQENHKTIGGTKIVLMVMNLVQHSRLKKVDERDLQIALLKHKEEIISNSGFGCLKESEEHDVVEKASQELGLMHDVDSWFPWISDDDMSFGMELYSTIHYCPPITVEAAKLAAFFESLLTNESLNTVVAATMENIQPRAGDNIKDFTAVNMWYERLDERYNFSLGSNILSLLTSNDLEQLEALEPPYLKHHQGFNNELIMSSLFGKLNHILSEILINFNFQKRTQPK